MEKEQPKEACPQASPQERLHFERKPLGDKPYLIRLSREELGVAYQHRSLTSEPIQSFVRRLLREYDLVQDQQTELHNVLNPNDYIRDFILDDGAKDWRHTDLVKQLYEVDRTFTFNLFSPKDETQLELPQSVIAVADMRVEILAAYRLSYNPNGLFCEILHNEKHLDRPFWAVCESHLHERVHQMQEWLADKGDNGYQKCKGGWHNAQFVGLCEDVGLHPMLGIGAHWKPADGQFSRIMDRLDIPKPIEAGGAFPKPEDKRSKDSWWDRGRGTARGKSTLALYTADACNRSPRCKIRSGRTDLQIRCMECEGTFRPQL